MFYLEENNKNKVNCLKTLYLVNNSYVMKDILHFRLNKDQENA